MRSNIRKMHQHISKMLQNLVKGVKMHQNIFKMRQRIVKCVKMRQHIVKVLSKCVEICQNACNQYADTHLSKKSTYN